MDSWPQIRRQDSAPGAADSDSDQRYANHTAPEQPNPSMERTFNMPLSLETTPASAAADDIPNGKRIHQPPSQSTDTLAAPSHSKPFRFPRSWTEESISRLYAILRGPPHRNKGPGTSTDHPPKPPGMSTESPPIRKEPLNEKDCEREPREREMDREGKRDTRSDPRLPLPSH